MAHTHSMERAESYAAAYRYTLARTRAGRGQKGRAAAKVARRFGVSRQYVYDVLVYARRLGMLPGTASATPQWTAVRARVYLADMVRALRDSPYVGGL